MKKVICILLAITLMLSIATPVFAEESEEIQYGTLKVEYSDALGSVERLDVMVKDDHVYADAVALSDRLGYDCIQDGELVSIYTDNNFFYPNAPLLAVHFYMNENKVAYNPLFGAEYEYTAPAPCIVDENGVWVPLTYTVVLLGGNSTMLDDTLLIQMPQNNVLSIAAMIVNNEDTLSFDWVSHFGYSETTTNVTDGAGRIVTLFSGLLEFDGDAWLSLIDWSAFDKKFGKSLVTMFCTNSAEELEESIDQVERLLEVFSEDGKLGEVLRKEQIKIDGDVEKWWNECEDYLKMLESGSGSPSEYNRLYQQFEKAMGRQSISMALGGDNLIYLQDGLSSATNVLDIASILGSTVTYLSEFQQKDDYMFSVLKNYLKQRISTDEVPAATVQAMADRLTVMDLGGVGYSAYRFIEDNWLKCLVDESGMDTLLGAPANILLLAWDIMSGTIPFYSDGLKAVENREISNYAQKVQNDALENLKHLITKLKNSSSLSAEECVQLSEYCYIYLKACYIARSSAIKSLDNTSKEFREQIKGRLDVEADINQLTIQYLAVLSSADIKNSCYILGFLPNNNEEYLNDYSDGALDNVFVLSPIVDLDKLVTDAYICDCTSSIESRYSYATGKSMTGMYCIPQINLSHGDVERINQEIYNSLYPMIEESVADIKEYGYPGRSGEIEYNWAVNGDILSLVIRNFRSPSMSGWDEYTVYNLSIDSGLLISDAEVISAAGFTSGEFKQRAKEVLGSSFWGNWDLTNENFEQASFVEFFNDRLRRTLSDENIEDVRPYINEKGQLCIIGRKYSMAAGDSYLYDLNMIDFKFVDYYADEATVLSKAGNYEDTSDSVDYPASAFNVDASYRVGDVFQLGSYEQDGNTKNGTEPIQWRVLDSEQGKILVISVKAIECKQFHSKDETVMWENSDLRQWLNNDFYQTAFSESERGYILLSNVSSEPNPKNNIDPGSNTSDYIYIPSISEMQQYFKSNSDRKCVATKYAISRGAYAPKDQNYCTWWLLRNPGEAGDKVANVNTDGRIDYIGSRVESVNGAVRVMMWLELKESATPDETKPTESHDQTHKIGDYTINDIKTNGYGFYIMYDDGTFDKYYSGSVLVWEGPRPMTYGADYIPESLIISSSRDDINRERIKKGKLVLVCSETNRVEYSLTPVEFSGNALSTTVEGKTAAMFLTKTSVNHWTSGRNIG